jgi:hypothetical protein
VAGTTNEAGTAYLSGAPELICVFFYGVPVAQSLVLCVVLCKSLFIFIVILFFFFWS